MGIFVDRGSGSSFFFALFCMRAGVAVESLRVKINILTHQNIYPMIDTVFFLRGVEMAGVLYAVRA